MLLLLPFLEKEKPSEDKVEKYCYCLPLKVFKKNIKKQINLYEFMDQILVISKFPSKVLSL